MQKLLIIFIIVPILYASYNPFFKTEQAPMPQKQLYIPVKKAKPIPTRTAIGLEYFGFIETDKGIFALVSFKNKTIVLQVADSLYLGEQTYKVFKISTNFLKIKDKYGRVQKVYFSSEVNRQQN